MMNALKGKSLATRGTRPWLYLIVAAIFVVLDQLSKWLVVTYLKPQGSVRSIDMKKRLLSILLLIAMVFTMTAIGTTARPAPRMTAARQCDAASKK